MKIVYNVKEFLRAKFSSCCKYYSNRELLPLSFENYNVYNPLFHDNGSLLIIMYGKVITPQNYTFNTIKIYLQNFPKAKIILSIQGDYSEKFISEVEKLGVIILKNNSNENNDTVLISNAINRAKDFNAQYLLVTRSEHRLLETNLYEFFVDLMKNFPLDKTVTEQKGRIIIPSYETYKYKLYRISNLFMFGFYDDLARYWKEALVENDDSRGILQNYLGCIGYRSDDCLKKYWNVLSRYFCVIDTTTVKLVSLKKNYPNMKYRNFNAFDLDKEEISFKDWLTMYNGHGFHVPENVVSCDRKNNTIIARTACLGKNIVKRFYLQEYNIVEANKQRVDYAYDKHFDKNIAIKGIDFAKYEKGHGNVEYSWVTQEQDLFDLENVSCIIMDSFSELVDKRFRSKSTGKEICSCFGDFDKDTGFFDDYEVLGLLDINKIEEYYNRFFNLICLKYGKDCPIIFIVFPTKYEKREVYLDRAEKISCAVHNLQKQYANLSVIDVDFIQKDENDPLIYHFSDLTYDYIARKVAGVRFAHVCVNRTNGFWDNIYKARFFQNKKIMHFFNSLKITTKLK